MEYLCHKRPRICFSCRYHFPTLFSYVSYYLVCIYINTMGETGGAGTRTLPEHLSSSTVFSGVRVTRVLVLCVCFVDRCLSLILFSFGHCVVYCSLYKFRLPLWCLQTRLIVLFVYFCIE